MIKLLLRCGRGRAAHDIREDIYARDPISSLREKRAELAMGLPGQKGELKSLLRELYLFVETI